MKYYLKLYQDDMEKYYLFDTDKVMDMIDKATGNKWIGIALGLATLVFVVLPVLVGCSGATGNIRAIDPTERGLSYVACAIITGAILRAFLNK